MPYFAGSSPPSFPQYRGRGYICYEPVAEGGRSNKDKNLYLMTQEITKGRLLAIDTGSTSTKLGYFIDGKQIFSEKLVHNMEELSRYENVMDQDRMRRDAIIGFLRDKGIAITDIDIVMARGGLFAPVITGVYKVNRDMRDVLLTCRDGVHACNLSAVIADDIAEEVNEARAEAGTESPFGLCRAYIADPPMADEMLPECRLGGIPEFPHRAFFHALNSRATVKQYLRSHGKEENDITAIVAHLGGGITVTLHRNGKVIDTNNGLGGDGPFTPERAGTCPAFPLIEMCFSGKYTEGEVKRKILGKGGAVAYFGTNDLAEIERRAIAGDKNCGTFLNAFCLNIAKYIASAAATVYGKVDVILLTGGIAYSTSITDAIRERVSFIAPVEIYAGEHELRSLAENGYNVLANKVAVHRYDKNAIVGDDQNA